MTHYLVELYLSRVAAGDLSAVAGRAREAVEGTELRYLRTIYLPEDEVCFHHFDGESEPALVGSLEAGSVRFERVMRAVVRP